MLRYYADSPTSTLVPRRVLVNHDPEEFVAAVERVLGSMVAQQARAILVNAEMCEKQNANALERLRRFALEMNEDELALVLGDYFDRLT